MPAPLSICLYCGSSSGRDPAFTAAAEAFGRAVAGRGARLVYGAGDKGLMGAAARAAQAAGGDVFGVIPRNMVQREWGKRDINHFIVTDSMHTRKTVMAANADAFAALPGGPGTLDEFFEILTWRQLGFHAKPIALVDVGGYWGPLVALIDHAIAAGFARPELRELFFVANTPEEAVDQLLAKAAP